MDDKPSAAAPSATRETAEPVPAATPIALPASTTSTTSTPAAPAPTAAAKPPRDTSNTSIPTPKRLQPKRTTSATNSPIPSRESSPARPSLKSNTSVPVAGGRSRKNSYDVSPSRAPNGSSTNPPSAAAQQRILSATTTPALHPVASEPAIKAPAPQKAPSTAEPKDSPRWPVSPRLRSPPPVGRPNVTSPRKAEPNPPAINLPRAERPEEKPAPIEADGDEPSVAGTRSPARTFGGSNSTLETVQENSLPNSPARGLGLVPAKEGDSPAKPDPEQEKDADSASNRTIKAKTSNESGSDSGGKSDGKAKAAAAAAAAARPGAPVKSYTTPAAGARGKPSGEGSARNMTVETETVSSIPQVAVGVGASGAGNIGSLRAKPSAETIRPKKEKKKTSRKAPSLTSGTGEQFHLARPRLHHHHHSRWDSALGSSVARSPEGQYSQGLYSFSYESGSSTSPERPSPQASRTSSLNTLCHVSVSSMLIKLRTASSKADIFEAKVASAVDEANSSDSEETFVYESNPPDTSDRPRRFHSRTPSATSMASQVDQRNGARDATHSVTMKKSMKFANSYSSNQPDAPAGEDDGSGTIRSHTGTGRGTAHHHHIGRWGRNGGNGHASLFDNESPFPNASKSKLGPGNNSTRHSPRQTSPRVSNGRAAFNGKKSSMAYDLDDGADDERTPLINTVRSGRMGRRRQPPSIRQLEHQASRQGRPFINWFAGCLVMSLMIILVVSASLGFMFATTQPLADVKILALKDILASEQDIIFDMKVAAKNPNVAAVTIDSTDLVIFAKSEYAGTDAEWWARPQTGRVLRRGVRRSSDLFEPDPEAGPGKGPNLEIGHVYQLDSPLTFEGSPFKHTRSESTGQIRISHPGNHTTPAGSRRWGNVLQHEFELIVRGTLKYTLPLSQKVRKISVEGRATVKPNAADDPDDDDDDDPDTVRIN